MQTDIGQPRHLRQAGDEHPGIGLVPLHVWPGHLHVDGGGRAEVQDLADDVGGQEGEGRTGEVPGQLFAQRLDETGGRAVAFLQRDQDIAVLRADAAGVGIGAVDAADRQADIVDDGVELVGGNDPADAVLDMVEQRRRLLDPGADGRADVEADLPRIDRGEEIAAQHRHQRERHQHHDHEADDEGPPPGEGEGEQPGIIAPHRLEPALETMLEPA